MRKILFLTLLLMIFGCGCNNQTFTEGEMTETDPTTVGGYDYVVIIDGNAEIVETGTPYTDEEIMTALENKMERLQDEFGSGSYLSSNGYYQISYNEEKAQMELDYYHYYIPVVKDCQMIGYLYIWPYPDGTLYVDPWKFREGDWGERLGELLEEKKELAMFNWPVSEYVVSSDNEVFTLHGNENPNLLNIDKLYSTLNHGDNLLTEKIFNEDEYYYRWDENGQLVTTAMPEFKAETEIKTVGFLPLPESWTEFVTGTVSDSCSRLYSETGLAAIVMVNFTSSNEAVFGDITNMETYVSSRMSSQCVLNSTETIESEYGNIVNKIVVGAGDSQEAEELHYIVLSADGSVTVDIVVIDENYIAELEKYAAHISIR